MVSLEGFEPPASWFVAKRSYSRLSYRDIGGPFRSFSGISNLQSSANLQSRSITLSYQPIEIGGLCRKPYATILSHIVTKLDAGSVTIGVTGL